MTTISINIDEKIIKNLKKDAEVQNRSVSNLVEVILSKHYEVVKA